MSAEEIANKLWNLCNVLRDDGITYHEYLNELTYLLFLRLAEVKEFEKDIPKKYRWETIIKEPDNNKKLNLYKEALNKLSSEAKNNRIKEIFKDAKTALRKPVNLDSLMTSISKIDWYDDVEKDAIATIYESLLEKNAGEKKSGAGQYFTPRPLINIMVDLMAPKLGEKWNDPACGTFGFMIAADTYLREKSSDYYSQDANYEFQVNKAFSGVELVPDAHRLALMNAKLHGMESSIVMGDSLSSKLETQLKGFDGVLANPPFGTKKGGEKPTREFTYETSNKQLNFLQVIYNSLHKKGSARAAVVLPDNVLFEDGKGQEIRKDLMNKCNLHTILRLPTGIFYAQGVKTNVLFFTRGKTENNNTKGVWYYDLRTNMPSFGKRTLFTRAAFEGFVKAYTAGIELNEVKEKYSGSIDYKKREAIKDERWSYISREAIAKKNDSLDLGLITDESLNGNNNLGQPIDIAKQAQKEIKDILNELDAIMKELR